jgi:hypothetical protein
MKWSDGSPQIILEIQLSKSTKTKFSTVNIKIFPNPENFQIKGLRGGLSGIPKIILSNQILEATTDIKLLQSGGNYSWFKSFMSVYRFVPAIILAVGIALCIALANSQSFEPNLGILIKFYQSA